METFAMRMLIKCGRGLCKLKRKNNQKYVFDTTIPLVRQPGGPSLRINDSAFRDLKQTIGIILTKHDFRFCNKIDQNSISLLDFFSVFDHTTGILFTGVNLNTGDLSGI